MSDSDTTVCVWFNPTCSKCVQTRDLLDENGVAADYVEYLQSAPDRTELVRVLGMLGFDDPRQMMRTGEREYAALGLEHADRDRLFEAMVEHPILIERPIVIRGDRAVIGRPPERVLDLL